MKYFYSHGSNLLSVISYQLSELFPHASLSPVQSKQC